MMKNVSVILSISMLISGKEDMLKSLESLTYFKKAIPCEIILVDTGCNAEQRKCADKYADQVIDFVWCNDFAAARNVGLKEARGEWFLYLDDDEWFDHPKEIIHFFQSGEYKNYNCASYVIRNYTNKEGTMYNDAYSLRMVKLEKKTRFVGKVHEHLEPFNLPKKEFTDFVHHYGYVYKDEEAKRKHAKRNIEPLRELRKEYPGDPRWIAQLAQEYFSLRDYEATIKECIEGLKEWNCLKEEMDYAPAHIGGVYSFIIISLESMERFEEEEEWLRRAFSEPVFDSDYLEPTLAFFCMAAARMYGKLNKYELCQEYFIRYINYRKKWKDNRRVVEAGTVLVSTGVFQEQLLYGVVLISLESLIRMQNYKLVEEAFYLLDWEEKKLLQQVTWETKMVDAFCNVEYHSVWVKVLQTLVSRMEGEGMREMYPIFLEREIEYKRQKETEKLSRLRKMIAKLNLNHQYIAYTKILWAAQDPDVFSEEMRVKCIQSLFEKMFEKHFGEILEMEAEVWDVAGNFHISIEPLILQIDFLEWKYAAEKWSVEASIEDLRVWESRIALWKERKDIRYDFFDMKCIEGYLRHYQEVDLTLQQREQMLLTYASKVTAFYKPYYKEFVFEEISPVLPEEIQLALNMEKVFRYQQCKDEKRALATLAKCVNFRLASELGIVDYAQKHRDQVVQKEVEAKKTREEITQLAKSLSLAARQCIDQKDYNMAKNILQQVLQCMPENAEARDLLEQMENSKL